MPGAGGWELWSNFSSIQLCGLFDLHGRRRRRRRTDVFVVFIGVAVALLISPIQITVCDEFVVADFAAVASHIGSSVTGCATTIPSTVAAIAIGSSVFACLSVDRPQFHCPSMCMCIHLSLIIIKSSRNDERRAGGWVRRQSSVTR